MGRLSDVLMRLAPPHDAELREGYQRYEEMLAKSLSPEQLDTYAASVEQSGVVRIFDEMTGDEIAALSPEEGSIAGIILKDEYLTLENRRVAALLNQRGQHDVAPDLMTQAKPPSPAPVVPEPPSEEVFKVDA